MNQRIDELYCQATYQLANEIGNFTQEKLIEKFAELIVRECDRYVAEHYDEMEPWMQPGDLLKHFGVEQ